jgi:transposase-like protein
VLSEAVANAWDADADEVRITLRDEIEIVDNGTGMGTVDEINRRFLTVGYKRRLEGRVVTVRGRHVMGRKGIGKLSLFAIADEIIVDTWTAEAGRLSFVMRTEDIRTAIAEPDPVVRTPVLRRRCRPERSPGCLHHTRRSSAAALSMSRGAGSSRSRRSRRISGSARRCLRNWMARADVDEGRREGVTSAERAELVELRRRNRVLEMELEIVKRASAYFARENVLPK